MKTIRQLEDELNENKFVIENPESFKEAFELIDSIALEVGELESDLRDAEEDAKDAQGDMKGMEEEFSTLSERVDALELENIPAKNLYDEDKIEIVKRLFANLTLANLQDMENHAKDLFIGYSEYKTA